MLGEQPVELGGQRAERSGLDLHEQAGTADVDDEAFERYLEFVARLSLLQQPGRPAGGDDDGRGGSLARLGAAGSLGAAAVRRPPPQPAIHKQPRKPTSHRPQRKSLSTETFISISKLTRGERDSHGSRGGGSGRPTGVM